MWDSDVHKAAGMTSHTVIKQGRNVTTEIKYIWPWVIQAPIELYNHLPSMEILQSPQWRCQRRCGGIHCQSRGPAGTSKAAHKGCACPWSLSKTEHTWCVVNNIPPFVSFSDWHSPASGKHLHALQSPVQGMARAQWLLSPDFEGLWPRSTPSPVTCFIFWL